MYRKSIMFFLNQVSGMGLASLMAARQKIVDLVRALGVVQRELSVDLAQVGTRLHELDKALAALEANPDLTKISEAATATDKAATDDVMGGFIGGVIATGVIVLIVAWTGH